MYSLFFVSMPYSKLHQRWLISALGLGWAAHPACFSPAVLCPAGPWDTTSKELFKLFCLFLGGSVMPLCHVPIAGRWKLPSCRYKRVVWSVIRHVPDDKVLCSCMGDTFIQITQMRNIMVCYGEKGSQVLASSRVAGSRQTALKSLPSQRTSVAWCSLHFPSHLTKTALSEKGTLATLKDYCLREGETGRQNHNKHLITTVKNKPSWIGQKSSHWPHLAANQAHP